MTEEHRCRKCGEVFDSERGLHVHQSRMHESQEGYRELLEPDNFPVKAAALIILGIVIGMGTASLYFSQQQPAASSQALEPGLFLNWTETASEETEERAWAMEINRSNTPSIGRENASVEIFLYQDYACESCLRFEIGEDSRLEFIKENYVETGEAKVYWKPYPTDSRNWSMRAAVGLECVYRSDSETFFEVKDRVFENQKDLNLSNIDEKILEWFEGGGESKAQVERCIEENQTEENILDQKNLGNRLGVFMTPSLIIDDKLERSYWILHGLETEQRYESVIESAISSSKQHS